MAAKNVGGGSDLHAFRGFSNRYVRLLMGSIRATESVQADLLAWDPERNQPILLQVKHSPRVLYSLGHEIAHFRLSHGISRQTDPAAEGVRVKQDVCQKTLTNSALLASLSARARRRPHPARENESRDIEPGEPVWLSWTRDWLESRLRPLYGRTTTDVLIADDRSRSALFDAIAKAFPTRLSVKFVTALLARTYRDGQLLLASSKRAAQRHMLARLVSAFAHQPTAPAFLLVMLAAALNYGYRSEPDHHSLHASVQRPPLRKGTACLVT